ncbi:MAG: preprotein translocase subunit SecE [Pseudonocardiaceae bacterium]
MSDDGEKDQDKSAARSSRPETAAGRRERRSSGRAGGGNGSQDPAAKGKAVARGKSAGSTPAGRKDRPTPKRDRAEEKEALPKRIVRYIREVLAELRKVIWPTRKQMVTYTIVVLAFMAFMVGLVAVLDLVFARAMFALFG